MVQLVNGAEFPWLKLCCHVWPPTATFKGERDGEGDVTKRFLRDRVKAGSAVLPDTRAAIKLLWSEEDIRQPHAPAPGTAGRAEQTIDKRYDILVLDVQDEPTEADRQHPRILILDSEKLSFDATPQPGIMARHLSSLSA
jgi:hypothetical protein